jgi:peptide/nickel transport system permease protein
VILHHALRSALIRCSPCSASRSRCSSAARSSPRPCSACPGSATWSSRRCCGATIPVIQGALLVIAGLYVLINLATDLLYLVVDPRVTY